MNNTNIIALTVNIMEMHSLQHRDLLLKLLASHPGTVATAMGVHVEVSKESAEKKAERMRRKDEAAPIWRVVFDGVSQNRIANIKALREQFGWGLAEAKYWQEGQPHTNNGVRCRDKSARI